MLTEKQLTVVEAAFNTVSNMFTYKTDAMVWQREEHWEDPAFIADQLARGEIIGDCDNFALACRYHLFQYDIPNRIVFCLTETGEGHLVCEAEGYILDNRQTKVMPWKSMPYKWIKISDYKIGGPWRNVTA